MFALRSATSFSIFVAGHVYVFWDLWVLGRPPLLRIQEVGPVLLWVPQGKKPMVISCFFLKKKFEIIKHISILRQRHKDQLEETMEELPNIISLL